MAPDPPDGEQRNGSDQVLRQMVWGLGYVDELVQVGINRDPQNATTSYDGAHQENECERFFWACCDANYNVIGMVGGSADINDFGGGSYLAERYAYSPYGRRTVFSHGWLQSDVNGDGKLNIDDYGILDRWIGDPDRPHRVELALDLNGDGRFNGDDYAVLDTQIGQGGAALANDPQMLYARLTSFRGPIHATNVMAAASVNEFGHQGLMEDEETGLIYNRGRMLNPTLGRFLQRDPAGYVDGLSLYEYVMSDPIGGFDPSGRGKVGRIIGNVIGSVGGTIAGALTGSAVDGAIGATGGSVVPGVGTAVGAAGGVGYGAVTGGIAGGVAGYASGGAIGDKVGDWLAAHMTGSGSGTGGSRGSSSGSSGSSGSGSSGSSCPNLPKVNKAVNSDITHAAERAVSRLHLSDEKTAADALRNLSKNITKSGFPPGTVPDPLRADSVLVPFDKGKAVYEVTKKGTAILRTVIE
jgi:RHS repeat-associated protein